MEKTLTCQRCGTTWIYKGKNEYYATCPYCLTKVKVRKEKEVKKK